jgi:hypothetical protein
LDTSPNTKGSNRTWCLWFGLYENETANIWNDYQTKWGQYRLRGEASTLTPNAGDAVTPSATSEGGSVKAEVEMARQRISKVAGVSPDAVRITIAFG